MAGPDCPICLTGKIEVQALSFLESWIRCERCGDFLISNLLGDTLRTWTNNDQRRRLLSYRIRSAHDSFDPKKEIPRKPYLVNQATVESLDPSEAPDVLEQMDNLLLAVGARIGNPTAPYIEQWNSLLARIGGGLEQNDADYILGYLKQGGLIETRFNPNQQFEITLTPYGWQQIKRLREAVVSSRRIFLALAFGHDELDNFIEKHLRPAVKDTGFDLFRLNDETPAGSITNRMRVEIRNSRLLIAEVSHNNTGAYWEAGFAEGLGRPVIYICQDEQGGAASLHFDVRQQQAVIYSLDNPTKAAFDLKMAIRASLPTEAIMQDSNSR
jgi:hypothetical protein